MQSGQNSPSPGLLLASQSPVRATILRNAGLSFTPLSAPVDERAIETQAIAEGASPKSLSQLLACAKAAAVSHTRAADWVIGADQILECAGQVLHKPQSVEQAGQRLRLLSGRAHHLHTSFSLQKAGVQLAGHIETATLHMRELDDAEITALIERDPLGACQTPGAYRIETPAIQLFTAIKGDHFAILGLPLLPLLAQLRVHVPHLLLPATSKTGPSRA